MVAGELLTFLGVGVSFLVRPALTAALRTPGTPDYTEPSLGGEEVGYSPVQPLGLWRDLELDALLLWSWSVSDTFMTSRLIDSPRSLMLKTPLTVLLVRRCLGLDSPGEAGASSMAESTLLNGALCSCTSAAIGGSGDKLDL